MTLLVLRLRNNIQGQLEEFGSFQQRQLKFMRVSSRKGTKSTYL